MALTEAPLLFHYEVESSEDLTFIPMCVRFNLDRFGLRISLAQWQLLPYEDRRLLARFPVDEDTEIEPNFDHALFEMLRTHAMSSPNGSLPRKRLPGGTPRPCRAASRIKRRSRTCARWPSRTGPGSIHSSATC